MKKLILPILLVGLLTSCGPSSNPTTSVEEPTSTPTTVPTTVPTTAPTTSAAGKDITISVPTDLGVELTDIKDAKLGVDGDYHYVYGIIAQFTYGYDTELGKDAKVGFYLVDNTGSMYVYCGYGKLDDAKIGQAVLVNGEIAHFISQAEASQGAEIGYLGAEQLKADNIEIIDSGYTEIPDAGIETKTIKELATTNFRDNDLSGTIFRVNATLTYSDVSGTAVYYFNDPSMDYGIYTYSTISGREFDWLSDYVGKTSEWTIAVHSLRSKDEAWRCIPIEYFRDVELSDEDNAKFALDRLEKQFTKTYNSTTSIKLKTQDEKLLDESVVTYTSDSNDHSISTTNEGIFLNIDSTKLGKFNVTINLSYKNKDYTRKVEIEVIEKVAFDGITIAEVNEKVEGEIVKIKGIYVRTAANCTGIYLADETDIIPVYYTADFIPEDYMIGEELIFEGEVLLDFTNKGNHPGYKRLANARLISHDSTVHEWNTNLVDGEKTISDMSSLTDDNVKDIYIVRGKVKTIVTDFYSNKQLLDPTDENKYIALYCSSAAQIGWLDEYEGVEHSYYVIVRDKNNSKFRFEILDLAE